MTSRGKAQDNFRAKAPWIMALLMRDFALAADDAAAILGNLGHESGGLVALQEIKPTVKGSKGGYGWPMWTGARRRAYEAYCARNKLDPAGDQANYKYLFVELSGSERGAVHAVKKAKGLAAKVKAFELNFERAGVKHYDSRLRWAEIARDAWRACDGRPALPVWAAPPATKPAPKPAGKPADAQKPVPTTTDVGKTMNGAPRPPVSHSVPIPGPLPGKPPVNPAVSKGVFAGIVLAIGGTLAWFWETLVNFVHSIF